MGGRKGKKVGWNVWVGRQEEIIEEVWMSVGTVAE